MASEAIEHQNESRSPPQLESPRPLQGERKKDIEIRDGNGVVEVSEEARIERLGRMRPERFRTVWEEIGFCFSVVMSQALTEYFVSGFNVILPTVAQELNIPRPSQTWPTAAFSLVVSSFLLTFGRLSDMYGGKLVYVCGIAWLFVWSIVAANAQNELMMDFCRALQGLGPAAYLPSSLMLLGSIYRPGPRKNLVFSIYGAMAPLGFYIGIFFAGVTAEFATWSWFFYIGAILTGVTGVIAYFTIPSDTKERRQMNIKMDWLGAVLISTGLILVVFAITDSSHAPNGWATPYIPTLLAVGLIILGAAVYVEGWVAEMPLLPADLFKVKYMTPLIIALLFNYGTLGIFLLYATFYMTYIMGGSPMQLVAWFTPMALGGCIIATVGGFVLHIISGTIIVIIAGVSWIIAPLLFAIMPVDANFWAYTFPSMVCATVAIDLTFNVTNIFITTSMPLRRQGLAGALINSILQLGIAISLGFADIVASGTEGKGLRRSYKAVFWFEVAWAVVALVLLVGFVKLDKAKSELTADEREELEMRSRREQMRAEEAEQGDS
ncbi:MFS general substrate transporter [Rhizodiscina lignyota]|uniref:MFS general substrate transporter n=1 Tax=Rhizodiscina lignyota TaxID=1504668 RepID=A0A9P4I6N2_9PEZI|nr:MFS general substrate transporter [Rhizodiscina lignyota]